jgi:cysteine desulfurase/selenocysteine lyase
MCDGDDVTEIRKRYNWKINTVIKSMCSSNAKNAERWKGASTVEIMGLDEIRKDFAILKTGIIYLDSTATSLTPEPVIEKMLEFYREYRANVERGIHRLSQRTSEEYESARCKVAHFINAKSPSEIIMTRNTTESINLVALGLKWKKDEKIVTSILEHHSNFIVWLRVRDIQGVRVEVVMPRKPMVDGLLDPEDFEKVIDDKTRLVAVTHVSNVLGSITPVEEIAEIAHEHGALVLIDAAQSVPHMKVDVQKLGCDFLAFSGHKMCAPTGSGVLYLREKVQKELEPPFIGGGTIENVNIDNYRLEKGPGRYEAGTPDIGGVIGLGAAVDYLQKIGMNKIERYERLLTNKMYAELVAIRKVELYGPEPTRRVAIMAFNVDDLNPHDVALTLDVSANIMVRSGHHCAQPLLKNIICKSGTVRASAYFYNTSDEIEKFTSTVKEIAQKLT